jgi:hypothetical protein
MTERSRSDRLFVIMPLIAMLTRGQAKREGPELAAKHSFQARTIAMQNTHLARMEELVIARDLSWL